MNVAFVVDFEVYGLSPVEVRTAFLQALRDAIAAESFAGHIDQAIAEEMFRALPPVGDGS